MAVSLNKEGFSISVITKLIECHQSTIAGVLKLKFETGDVKRIA